jgi:hypothetical protein
MPLMMTTSLRYCSFVVALLIYAVGVCAQPSNDLGMMGGSGITFTPTTAITPESHFRLDATRTSFHRSEAKGMNSVSLTSGLSPNMEFTVKFQSVQAGTSLSPSFVGFGGKFLLPFYFPFDSRAAVWVDFVSTPGENTTSFVPSAVYRGVLVVQPALLRKLNGNILLGMTEAENLKQLAVGFNSSRTLSELLKVGGEFQYNYYGRHDLQESVLLLLRVHPNACIQLSPGYMHSSVMSSWMISAGVSFSTTSIELSTTDRVKEKATDIPSFDDLEKQIHGEKKDEKK